MRKRDELSDPKSCLNRAADDEWLFVLREHDDAAVETILWWASRRIAIGKNKPNDPQILSAYEQVQDMLANRVKKARAPFTSA